MPDFKIKLSGECLQTELKGLDNIYTDLSKLFEKTCIAQGRKDLLDNYNLDVNQLNVHRNDFHYVKKGLEKKIRELPEDVSEETVKFSVDKYHFVLTKRTSKLPVYAGALRGIGSNLINNLNVRDPRQYQKIYFLSFVNLNDELDNYFKDYLNIIFDIADYAYSPKTCISMISSSNIFNSFTNIKFILIISPKIESSFVIMSPYLTTRDINSNLCGIIYHLANILKKEGYAVYISSLEINFKEYI